MKTTIAAIFVLSALLASFPNIRLSPREASQPTILFWTQNGETVNGQTPEKRMLQHLVLKRNGALTPGYERTLVLPLSGLSIPPSAAKVIVTVETQHGDPDLGGGEGNRIIVWQQAIGLPSGEQPDRSSLELAIRFEEYTNFQGVQIPTPTDYFRTHLRAVDLAGNMVYDSVTDYAFLMENQWEWPLPHLDEATRGAAPQRLVLYFCDMFPFELERGSQDGHLLRAQVGPYIQTELGPEMVRAIRTQTNGWGFPWYKEWTNYRTEEDAKTLSVALAAGDTWYHGRSPYPNHGYAGISIRVDGGFQEYDTLTDGIMSTFHHELFHNLQRNMSLHFAGHGDIDGIEDAWEAISEGTAVLASSVAQPDIQFGRTKGWRSYLTRARIFLGGDGTSAGDLNRSYAEIGIHAAIYWRFLYEQCGGMKNGTEDPAAGMQVIRALLETLYRAEIVHKASSRDIVANLAGLMDSAIGQTSSCPFTSYTESLNSFALAIYKLNLEEGRCTQPGLPRGCGFYDPNGLYPVPVIQNAELALGSGPIPGENPSSYGIDFIKARLTSEMNGHSLRVEFAQEAGSSARYSVQVLEIGLEGELSQLIMLTENPGGGTSGYEIEVAELGRLDCLVLIITRLDGNETTVAGGYEVTFWAD